MRREINFKKETEARGRNGYFKQFGIEASLQKFAHGDELELRAISSRGVSDSAILSIPIENVADVISGISKTCKTDPFISLHEDIFQLSMMYGHWAATNDPETVFTGGSVQAMGDIIAWAKEFNAMNANREWDGEWYEELEAFFSQKMKGA